MHQLIEEVSIEEIKTEGFVKLITLIMTVHLPGKVHNEFLYASKELQLAPSFVAFNILFLVKI